MAVPLMLRDRLKGVVYLDSSLARGVFTPDDLDVLGAIANHIAIAMETSRTARLEAAVEAERAQRRLAERLRSATTAITSCLQTAEVASAGLTSLGSLVAFQRAVLWVDGQDALVVGFDGSRPMPTPAECAATAAYARARETGRPQMLDRELPPPHVGADLEDRALVVAPLTVRGDVLGLLTVEVPCASAVRGGAVDLIDTFSAQLAIALENARLFGQVQEQATVDPLTGALNRRQFFALVDGEVARTRRHGNPLSVVMLDADHFKRVNDTHGHAAGDDVLVEITARVRQAIRAIDSVGRYGGEEFALLLSETEEAGTEVVAERVRQLVLATPIQTRAGAVPVSVSLGVSCCRGAKTEAGALFQQADDALYAAKEGGRNRVVRASTLVQGRRSAALGGRPERG